jgi:hypothetical protein
MTAPAFIRLTLLSNFSTYLNPAHIISVTARGNGVTAVRCVDDYPEPDGAQVVRCVKESPEEILALLFNKNQNN